MFQTMFAYFQTFIGLKEIRGGGCLGVERRFRFIWTCFISGVGFNQVEMLQHVLLPYERDISAAPVCRGAIGNQEGKEQIHTLLAIESYSLEFDGTNVCLPKKQNKTTTTKTHLHLLRLSPSWDGIFWY